MNLKRIFELYEIIKNRMPSTYPSPSLAFFQNEKALADNTGIKKKDDENVYAVVNPETTTISLPMEMKLEFTNKKGEIRERTVSITKIDEDIVMATLLYEICHLVSGERYGYESKQYHDENLCEAFAKRWLKVMKKEKLI